MYPSQQHTYIENNNNHSAKVANNNGLFIKKQTLTSVHQPHTVASPSILFHSTLLPTLGHTTHTIGNNLVSFFGKPDQPSVTIIQIEYSPPSISLPSMLSSAPSSPSRRYAHTTTLVKTSISTAVFLVGGARIEDDMPLFDIWKLDWDTKIWTNLNVRTDSPVPGLMGHVTLLLPHQQSVRLLTCFGANHREHDFFNGCALFNTDTLHWKSLKHKSSVAQPVPRIYASMIPMNDTHAVLYGGESTCSILLGDLWWLHLDDIDATVTFTPLGHSIPRAGHAASMVSDKIMLVHGGNYYGLDSTHDTMIVDLEDQGKQQPHQKRQLALASSATVTQGGSSPNGAANGPSGGVIGGIVVAVILVLGLSIFFVVFCQRRKSRQRNYDMHSRAARFSLSTPPRHSSNTEQRTSTVGIQQPVAAKTRISHMSFGSEFGVGLAGSRSSVSLPVNPKRTSSTWGNVSTHSIVSSINNHPNVLDSPSRQLYTNWVCETPIPTENNSSNNTRNVDSHHTSTYITQSTYLDENEIGKTGSPFDRLRLSIFKPMDVVAPTTESKNYLQQYQKEPHASSLSTPNQSISTTTPDVVTGQMEDQVGGDTSKRRSSMFGLSKLLNLGESNTGASRVKDQQYQYQDSIKPQQQQQQQQGPQNKKQQLDPRNSLGSKSVASLQWVEFNSEMDFNGNLTPRNLAVMNHRQSSATISSGSGFSSVDELNPNSMPTSPRDIVSMAQQLQQQHRHIRQQQQRHSTYRLSQRELQSWEDARLSRLVPPPHRLATPTPPKPSNSLI